MTPIFGQQQTNSYSLPMGGNNFMRANQIGGPSRITVTKIKPKSSLFGSSAANPGMQTIGSMGTGGMPQVNLFGSDKFGNPKYRLPSSEPREYFGPFKKEIDREGRLKYGAPDRREGPLSFSDLFEDNRRLNETAKKKIFQSYRSGSLTREQATSLADRIEDYFGNKAEQDLFSEITDTEELKKTAELSRIADAFARQEQRAKQRPVILPFDRKMNYGEGGSVRNAYIPLARNAYIPFAKKMSLVS